MTKPTGRPRGRPPKPKPEIAETAATTGHTPPEISAPLGYTRVGQLPIHTLAQWRTMRGMTVPALAKAAGVSINTVDYISHARSRATLATALALAAALEVHVEQIAWPEPTNRPPSLARRSETRQQRRPGRQQASTATAP